MIENIKITIDKDSVKEELGYKEITQSNIKIENLITEMIDFAYQLITPKGNYLLFDTFILDKSTDIIDLDNNRLQIASKDIVQLFKDQELIAILTTTIGNSLEAKVAELFSANQFTKATILDAIGSVAAEESINYLNTLVHNQAKDLGFYHSTMRYSPGYGDLNLDIQPRLLKLLEGDKLGITTTNSNILLPQKSITALIGFSKEATSTTAKCDFKCRECLLGKCFYRKN